MTEKVEDRRIRKTKVAIRQALLSLLEKRPLMEITVTQICSAADVNRGTFYAHYRNQQECFDEIAENVLKEMNQQLSAHVSDSVDAFLMSYFQTAQKHQAVFSEIHSHTIAHPAIKKLIGMANQWIPMEYRIPEDTGDLRDNYFLYGFFGLVRTWLNGGCKESPQKVIQIMHQLMDGITDIS